MTLILDETRDAEGYWKYRLPPTATKSDERLIAELVDGKSASFTYDRTSGKLLEFALPPYLGFWFFMQLVKLAESG